MLTIRRYEEHAGEHGGFLFYHGATNVGFGPPPTNRITQAQYMCNPSSKFQYVLREAHRLVSQGEKLIVYCDWPSNVWAVKLLLDTMGFSTARVSAGQSAKERAYVTKTFDDPDSKEIMILVCSSRSAAESYNFQKGCHNIIIMDVVSFNTVLQIIGRCYRLGQKHPQYIKILTLDRSYDQVLVANYATKMIAQMAATSGAAYTSITPEQVKASLADNDFKQRAEGLTTHTKLALEQQAKDLMYDDIVHAKFRRNFGIRSDRDNEQWADAKNLDFKLVLPEEEAFYRSKGGLIQANTEAYLRMVKDAMEKGGNPAPSTPAEASKDRQRHDQYMAAEEARASRVRRRVEGSAAKRKRAESKATAAANKRQKTTVNPLAESSEGESPSRFTTR